MKIIEQDQYKKEIEEYEKTAGLFYFVDYEVFYIGRSVDLKLATRLQLECSRRRKPEYIVLLTEDEIELEETDELIEKLIRKKADEIKKLKPAQNIAYNEEYEYIYRIAGTKKYQDWLYIQRRDGFSPNIHTYLKEKNLHQNKEKTLK